MSETDCRLCRWAEMSPWERLRERARLVLQGGPSTAEILAHTGHSLARMTSAVLGGPATPSAYEQHKQRYAETGDPAELARMLRHVQTDGEPPCQHVCTGGRLRSYCRESCTACMAPGYASPCPHRD